MKILILKEDNPNENRVAITPDIVKKYYKNGFEVYVETGAGEKVSISDNDYIEAGAKIAKKADDVLSSADIVASVVRTDFNRNSIKEDAIFISTLNSYLQKEVIEELKRQSFSSFSLSLLPRTTRAQSMDIISSQSNLAGYRSVIEAAYHCKKAAPMMMTAAGTITPLKFMILGAGVAGLQAIATSKRMGAVVCAFDVRSAAKEQVESLGAKFIEVKSNEKNDGVYAKEMSEEYKNAQQELLEKTIKTQDVVISTALIPGKRAPILITKEMIKTMKPGSIIVDLSASQGGNCALTKPGEVVLENDVTIIGYDNVPSRIAIDASMLFAKNLFNFIDLLLDKKDLKIKIDPKDDIIAATLLK